MDEQEPQPDAAPMQVSAETAQRATFEALMAKTRRERELEIPVPDGPVLKLKLVAISSKDYDDLIAACPPSAKERELGAVFDMDKFGPRLLARVVVDPALSVEEATQLWNSPNWAGGEIGGLFRACQALCNAGLDVPFNVSV